MHENYRHDTHCNSKCRCCRICRSRSCLSALISSPPHSETPPSPPHRSPSHDSSHDSARDGPLPPSSSLSPSTFRSLLPPPPAKQLRVFSPWSLKPSSHSVWLYFHISIPDPPPVDPAHHAAHHTPTRVLDTSPSPRGLSLRHKSHHHQIFGWRPRVITPPFLSY